jgi:hypothetical protein
MVPTEVVGPGRSIRQCGGALGLDPSVDKWPNSGSGPRRFTRGLVESAVAGATETSEALGSRHPHLHNLEFMERKE